MTTPPGGIGRGARPRRRLQNVALAAGALIAAWALVEFVVFPPALRHLPLRLHEHLDEPLQPLAQSSKAGTIPADYIAVLGDSYARGRGDWLLDVDAAGNPPYAAYHLLHDRLGVDILSLGRSAAGSFGAVVRWPVSVFDFLASTLRYGIAPPRGIVVLFYEGNDVQDNLRDLAIGLLGRPPSFTAYGTGDFERLLAAGARAPATMQRLIHDVVVDRSPWRRRAEEDSWTNDLVFSRFALRAGLRTVAGMGSVAQQMQQRYAAQPAPGQTRAGVGDRVLALPDGLQAPPFELSDREIALGVEALGHAIGYLRGMFPDAPVQLVYVPAPLTCYRLSGTHATAARYAYGTAQVDVSRVQSASDALAARVAAVATATGAGFVDARPLIRARAALELVHGPRDWEHFNRAGQEALAEAIVRGLRNAGR
jgi:hypothetical protein